MIQQDGYDLDKILEDINKANNNGKQDKFTEKKAFVVCNSQYSDKTGLGNLPATKNDLASIKRTISMMGIEEKGQTILEDTGLSELTKSFEKLKVELIAKTKVLIDSTGIGTETGTGISLSWARLKKSAFELVDAG